MRKWWMVLAAGWLGTCALADDKKPDEKKPDEKKAEQEKPKTPKEQLAAIKKSLMDEQTKVYAALDKLGETKEDEEKGNKLYGELNKFQTKQYEAALELAKADPKSETGEAALDWLLNTPSTYYTPTGKTALELFVEHHADSKKVASLVQMLGQFASNEQSPIAKPVLAFLDRTAEKHPEKAARGSALFAKAVMAKKKHAAAEYQQAKNEAELAKEAERAFEVVIETYGDEKPFARQPKKTIAERATVELFELRNLRVGKEAPDISGEDLDAKAFKLSEYRGKVVLLDFWGDW
jgi:hypothetical protein